MKILAINGSYRENGFTDQVLYQIACTLQEQGVEVEQVDLRNHPIEFCYNCRYCTQAGGDEPGVCVQQDAMPALIAKIEAADGIILASPTNCGSVTAVFKRFMERLMIYSYWPWDKQIPKPRQAVHKPAIMVTSSAAPTFIARWNYNTRKQLKMTARQLGTKIVAAVDTGLKANKPYPSVNSKTRKAIERAVAKLLVNAKKTAHSGPHKLTWSR